ncbi:MAG: hypothetical protein ACLFSQ_11100 [Candidatus Zixiibacteriota bacterium]
MTLSKIAIFDLSYKWYLLFSVLIALALLPTMLFGQLHRWSGFEIEKLEVEGNAEFLDSTHFDDEVVFADSVVFQSNVEIEDTLKAKSGIVSEGAITLPGGFAIDSVSLVSDSLVFWHSDSSFGIPMR